MRQDKNIPDMKIMGYSSIHPIKTSNASHVATYKGQTTPKNKNEIREIMEKALLVCRTDESKAYP